MAEKLLTLKDVAERLGVSPITLGRHKARLIAKGLKQVNFGLHPKYTESSLEKLIKNAAETGQRL